MKTQKGSVAVIILVILLVVGAGYWYISKNTSNENGELSNVPVLANIAFANDGGNINTDVKNISFVQNPENIKIINADTKEVLLSIDDVNAFGRKISETPEFFVGEIPVSDGELHYGAAKCFGSAGLSRDGTRIAFSTGCTPGLKPTFIGQYDIKTGEIRMIARNSFGVDFSWTGDGGSGISFTRYGVGSGKSERTTISSTEDFQLLNSL